MSADAHKSGAYRGQRQAVSSTARTQEAEPLRESSLMVFSQTPPFREINTQGRGQLRNESPRVMLLFCPETALLER